MINSILSANWHFIKNVIKLTYCHKCDQIMSTSRYLKGDTIKTCFFSVNHSYNTFVFFIGTNLRENHSHNKYFNVCICFRMQCRYIYTKTNFMEKTMKMDYRKRIWLAKIQILTPKFCRENLLTTPEGQCSKPLILHSTN
jgi:hypothetical protein